MTSNKPLAPPAYNKFLDGLTAAKLSEMVDRASDNLRARGARPPLNSRLHQARATILANHDSKALAKPGSRVRRLYAEAHRVAVEFYVVSTALNPSRRVPPKLHQKLQRAYGGSLDPSVTDDVSERARDMQFELYVGAWFAMSERPIDPSGPDLKVPVWFEWRGIAAKRVSSPSQLLKRVKRASAQIAEHHPTGFICVCLDNYSRRRNRGVVTAGTGNRFFLKYPHLRNAVVWLKAKSPHTLALVAFASLSRWERGRAIPHMEMSSLSQITVFSKDETERERLTDFFSEVQRGFDKYWKP